MDVRNVGFSGVLLLIAAALVVAPCYGQATDGVVAVTPSSCWMTATTTAFTAGPALVRAAANNIVLSGTTNTTAGTVAVTCDLTDAVMSRLQSAKGAVVNDVELFYGVQTTALSSIAAATLSSVTYPAPGGTAAGTVAAAGGTLTVTPATLQLTTTTSGQCFNEKLAAGTPFAMTSDFQKISVDQVFTTAGSTATTLQLCGLLIHFTWPLVAVMKHFDFALIA